MIPISTLQNCKSNVNNSSPTLSWCGDYDCFMIDSENHHSSDKLFYDDFIAGSVSGTFTQNVLHKRALYFGHFNGL